MLNYSLNIKINCRLFGWKVLFALFNLFLFFWGNLMSAQKINLNFQVIDCQDSTTIPGCLIFDFDQQLIGISDDNGKVTDSIIVNDPSKMITLSSLGYKETSFKVSDLQSLICLQKIDYEIDTVFVKSSSINPKDHLVKLIKNSQVHWVESTVYPVYQFEYILTHQKFGRVEYILGDLCYPIGKKELNKSWNRSYYLEFKKYEYNGEFFGELKDEVIPGTRIAQNINSLLIQRSNCKYLENKKYDISYFKQNTSDNYISFSVSNSHKKTRKELIEFDRRKATLSKREISDFEIDVNLGKHIIKAYRKQELYGENGAGHLKEFILEEVLVYDKDHIFNLKIRLKIKCFIPESELYSIMKYRIRMQRDQDFIAKIIQDVNFHQIQSSILEKKCK